VSARLARPAVAAGVVAAFALAGVASAAPAKPAAAPVCNLVTDDKGDAAVGPLPSDPNLDVTSADVSSNGKVVTAVIRLASYSDTDAQSPMGRTYYFGFNAPGATNQIYLSVGVDPALGTTYDYGDLEGSLYTSKGSDATGAIDAAKGTLTVTAPADLGGLATLKPGVKLTGLEVKSTALVGVAGSGLVQTVDTATGSKPYAVGTPSCVVPGKG
jgi:hypothetical protein